MSPAAADSDRPPPLLRGVDLAAFAVSFAVRLRHAGVAVGFTGIETFARGLAACPHDSKSQLYWLARVSLVRRHPDLVLFDAVFDGVFGTSALALDPAARRQPAPGLGDDDEVLSSLPTTSGDNTDGSGLPWATLPTLAENDGDAGSGLAVPDRLPSYLEGLADTPFDELDAADLALLQLWFKSALRSWPRRRSRRLASHPAGHRIDLRATLARARRTGWESVELVRNKPVDKPRRVVMICDVSRSMQAHATAYLHFMRAITLAADAEVFVFATSLTRLTRVLDHKSPTEAIEQATARVSDRFGGTRIAASLRSLLASHHGGCTRGALVIVASDGWDSDPPAELARVMARLRRRAHRVLWLNPRAASPGFEPLVAGMAAALPYCDQLIPANTVRALADVVEAVTLVP